MLSQWDETTELPSAARFSSLSAFDRLEMDTRYDLDLDELERQFVKLNRVVHPDFHSRKGRKQLIKASALSAAINDAYSTLRDPAKRAEYMLKRDGGPASSEDKRTPKGFLIEVMELREQFEDSKAAEDKDSLSRMYDSIKQRYDQRLAAIADGFTEPELNHQALREHLNVLKYFENLVRELEQALAALK